EGQANQLRQSNECPVVTAPFLVTDKYPRESQSTNMRFAALRTRSKIYIFEAAKMLLGVIQHDSTEES
ncbi:MAG: hypothetical protein ABI134_33185, partial [Byssovorax sp.]